MANGTRFRLSAWFWIIGIAIAAIVAIILWHAYWYQTPFQSIHDWQHMKFGLGFPASSVVLVMLVPLLIIYAIVSYRQYRKEQNAAAPAKLALVRSERFFRVLATAAGALVISLVAVLLTLFTLPTDAGPRPRVDATTNISPPDGGATVVGALVPGRVMIYEKRIGFATQTYQFAPVAPQRGGDGLLRYFVEIPAQPTGTDPGQHQGLILRDGVPYDVVEGFESAGYRVAATPIAVFQDGASLRWPYYALAVQIALLAALLLAAATVQWYSLRRIRRMAADID